MRDLVHWVRIKNRSRVIRRRMKRGDYVIVTPPTPPSMLELPVLESARINPATLGLATSEAPDVSIIIPAYGKVDVTLRCLAALHRFPPTMPYEVIVVEDASGEADAERVGLVPGVRFVVNKQNLGFLRSCNAAAQMARGRYLLLLNNDTQVMAEAVDALRRTFDAHPQAGLVGSKLIYPDGRLQEAGGIVWSDGSGRNHGRMGNRFAREYNYLRETDYVSGASIMVEAALWRQLGGFDERFCPAYYEDTDLAMQIRQAGRLVIYQPASTVVHLEGVSNGTDANPGIKRYQYVNAGKFLDKWREVLKRDHFPDSPDNIALAADRARHRPIVLVTNDLVVQPDVDAGSRAIMQSLEALVSLGCVVKYWPENSNDFGHYAETMRLSGIDVITGPQRSDFGSWVQRYGTHLSYVIMHRPHVTAHFLSLVRQYAPQAHVIYYGHDLHYQRVRAQAKVQDDIGMRKAAAELHEVEAGIWQRVDVSVYFSQEEVDSVRSQCPWVQAQAVQAYCFDEVVVPQRPIASRQLIFVAGFGHPPNVDAARWLVKEVMPMVWAQEPDVQLGLVGSKPTPEVLALQSKQVEVTGWVSDERLAELYAASRVAVVPLRFGAGVKHKVVEALSQGVPLVTTSVGAQGLPGLEKACAIADEAQALAQHIVTLLRDEAAWMDQARGAAAYIHEHFSRSSMQRQLAELLQAAAD
ncbi:glycosyltransferase [Azohydromonas caseinilytica]|uniref:Glycosyltransferase n=1 Tax=Azohydromonas caseinilytica TaxID=2728836 RepID=A0A848F662_9BURK|nr:glycosyltransferase [Azohydromonas caseinilytica]NML14166.1 glycosyltransferase [Azohydromonas caseinilytica]